MGVIGTAEQPEVVGYISQGQREKEGVSLRFYSFRESFTPALTPADIARKPSKAF